ncbi:MAG TPA: helix-turn-helix domain-containing protein [Frankiaceae bacterium]|jgi:AcrR family transcriptional regulator|nr:helix-turn-helix domain-containing protein [Frankiaceae bacterium]
MTATPAAATTTREQILRAALELFSSQGYDATSLRQIAERLGLTKAALYYHFPAKEHLVVELTRPFLEGFAEVVGEARAATREGSPIDGDDLIARYLDLVLEHHEVLHLLTYDPAAQNHPDVGQRARVLYHALQAEIVGRDAGGADSIRAACALAAVSAAATIPAPRLRSARRHVLASALAALHAE